MHILRPLVLLCEVGELKVSRDNKGPSLTDLGRVDGVKWPAVMKRSGNVFV